MRPTALTTLGLLLSTALLLSACGSAGSSGAGGPPTVAASSTAQSEGCPGGEPEANEYAVLSTAVNALFPDGADRFVVRGQTGQVGDIEALAKDASYPVGDDVVSDYKMKNVQPSCLGPGLKLHLPLTFLAPAEADAMFKGDLKTGWDQFYTRFPKAQGLMTLSRVGLARAGNQAVVYVANQRQSLDGAGHFVILEMKDGVWTVVRKHQIFIS